MKKLILVLAFLLIPGIVWAADVALKWDASVGATGYKIYQSTDGGVTWSTGTDLGNVLTTTVLGVDENTMVLFRVSAYNSSGESIRFWSGAWYDHRKIPISPPGGTSIP